MTHNHVVKWVCPRSAGARLSTRETGNKASCDSASCSITDSWLCVDPHLFFYLVSTWYVVDWLKNLPKKINYISSRKNNKII